MSKWPYIEKKSGVELNVPKCLGNEVYMDIICNWGK
jgi:hypothetical protein